MKPTSSLPPFLSTTATPFIGNQFRPSASIANKRLLINPATGKPLTLPIIQPTACEANATVAVQDTTADQVDEAIIRSRKCLNSTTANESRWHHSSAGSLRKQVLEQLADAMERDREQLAQLETLNVGKPIRDSRMEIDSALEIIRYYAGLILCGSGGCQLRHYETESMLRFAVRREPLGVCALITSYNYPLLLATWKLAPALASGNYCVLKPHQQTPLSTLYLAHLLKSDTDIPPDVVQVLPGGADVGRRLAEHGMVDKLSFTGSPIVGRKVLRSASETNLKRVTLELGGKNPLVVFADLAANDIDGAVEDVCQAAFSNVGQNCCAGSRLLVQREIYKDFMDKLVKRVQRLRIGDPMDEQTEIGPLINGTQLKLCLDYVNQAKQQDGIQLVCGGGDGYRGYYLSPTILANVPDHSRLAREEIFGPVLSVLAPFSTEQEAIRRANDSEFGLAAGVWTGDPDRAERVAGALQAGYIWINCYNAQHPSLPFAGFKQSGFGGCDLGEEAIWQEFTRPKSVVLKRPAC